jgi:hypothetical protein
LNPVNVATNFVKVLALPFDVYGAGLLLLVCIFISLFVRKIPMGVLLTMLAVGLAAWLVWKSFFVFDHPAGRNAGNFEIAGFVYSSPTNLFLLKRPDIANKASPERNSALLSNAGGDSSAVWTAGSLTASRFFGLLATCLFAAGLIGVFVKKIPGFGTAWRRPSES